MNGATAQNDLDTDLQLGPGGSARVTLRGRLNAQTTVPCWDGLEHGLRGANLKRLDVDASGLQVCDGAGLALLCNLNMGRMTPGASVSVSGLEAALDQIFHAFIREPRSPYAVLAMQVTFIAPTNGLPEKVILQNNYSKRIPINSTTPAVLMEGWNRALVEIFAEVTLDLQQQESNSQQHEDRINTWTQE